ncbi:MAG TPA: long-chain fatty acid--CoA ligase [Pyrinomonadaceae bacterium]|nr:long-chain fatty acid--CoA ligase [Pyrinomonadaceae bacterium]
MSATVPPTSHAAATPRPLSSHAPREPLMTDEPRTLVEVVERACLRHKLPDAFNYKRDGAWRSVSSEEFLARARSVARALRRLGVRPGERAAILSESCVEWVLADVGCLMAGVVDVPVYPTLAPQQICYIVNDSGARVLFVQNAEAYERVREAIRGCSTLEHFVVMLGDAGEAADDRTLTLAQLEERGRASEGDGDGQGSHASRPEELATIIYTSGTTGEPKGVMLTHSNVVSNLIDTSDRLAFSREDTVLSVLPLSHIFERGAMYMYIHHGSRVFFSESMEKIGENIREVRPTALVAVPRLYEKIYARIKERAAEGGRVKAALLSWAVEVGKRWARARTAGGKVSPLLALEHKVASRLVFSKWRDGVGGRVRMFTSGGAALPDELGHIFVGAGLPIVQGYGLTETSPVICVNDPEDNRIGTVGRPIRSVEVRIAEDGEIETRGPNVMVGYYNKPDATREVFTDDGWFKTGDIGALDAEGFLRITDRKKELFKTSGGKYIAPQPIEQRIKQSRFVNQVVLVGNGRKFPAALIVPDWELLRSYAQLKGFTAASNAEFCRHPRVVDLVQRQVDAVCADLAKYERVKRVALIERELTVEGGELTPTLKVKRRVVDEKYRDVIDELYKE